MISYSRYRSLEKCKDQAAQEISKNVEADYICARRCLEVKDGTRPELCEERIVGQCSRGICETNQEHDIVDVK
jgi:hypothetical protein